MCIVYSNKSIAERGVTAKVNFQCELSLHVVVGGEKRFPLCSANQKSCYATDAFFFFLNLLWILDQDRN